MEKNGSVFGGANNRRSFLKKGMVAAGTATIGAALLTGTSTAFGRDDDDNVPITKGDIAILTFLSALEQVEADLWIQYAELGGATNQGLSPIDLELRSENYHRARSSLHHRAPRARRRYAPVHRRQYRRRD